MAILRQRTENMTVYLIHFEAAVHHARHYIGYATDVARRLDEHRHGAGARLLAVCNQRGIGYDLARTWEGAGRGFERKLKRCKNAARYCPVCNGEHARDYHPKEGANE
jgi:predicted GIY-YIG superfamily endonuclease